MGSSAFHREFQHSGKPRGQRALRVFIGRAADRITGRGEVGGRDDGTAGLGGLGAGSALGDDLDSFPRLRRISHCFMGRLLNIIFLRYQKKIKRSTEEELCRDH